jgi:hypothetical protein
LTPCYNSLNIQAVLSAAATSIQPEVSVSFFTWNVDGKQGTPSTHRTVMNSTTDVTILPAPKTQNVVNEPVSLALYNKDVATVVATVKSDNGTTEIILRKATLAPSATLVWEKGAGWNVVT